MSEMVERVADGLIARFVAFIETSAGESFAETKITLPNRSTWLGYARAAIEAMREPTGEMIDDGGDVDDAGGDFCVGNTAAQNVYRAMIDAALKE